MAALLPEQADHVVTILDEHQVAFIREGTCCSSDTIECDCGWECSYGYEFRDHLLLMLGLEQRVLDNWDFRQRAIASGVGIPDSKQEQDYLSIFRKRSR